MGPMVVMTVVVMVPVIMVSVVVVPVVRAPWMPVGGIVIPVPAGMPHHIVWYIHVSYYRPQ